MQRLNNLWNRPFSLGSQSEHTIAQPCNFDITVLQFADGENVSFSHTPWPVRAWTRLSSRKCMFLRLWRTKTLYNESRIHQSSNNNSILYIASGFYYYHFQHILQLAVNSLTQPSPTSPNINLPSQITTIILKKLSKSKESGKLSKSKESGESIIL